MENIVQKWQCPKCSGVYESYVIVTIVTCRRKHPEQRMILVEGEQPTQHPRTAGRRDVRLAEPATPKVKAGKISTLEQLEMLIKKES